MTDLQQNTGYNKALSLLEACTTQNGFIASTTEKDNYKRVWARDGVIIGLAGLLTKNLHLRETLLRTLETLRVYQGPHGEIPSNVHPAEGKVSFGGTTGRVDADLWYIIGCGKYWEATGKDEKFLKEFWPSLERVQFLLGCWEYNNRGLLYIPQTGDWTDEYLQQGYVLYDQLLYWKALEYIREFKEQLEEQPDQMLREKVAKLQDLIINNYWFVACEADPPGAYHSILHKKGCDAAEHRNTHWMSFFSPTGYGYRFDGLANTLVSLLDIANDEQRSRVDTYITTEVVQSNMMLLPAYHPVIQPEDDAWNELEVSFSFSFKNKPYEFHNGGLWPFVTGFYVTDLAKRGHMAAAQQYLNGIDKANAMDAKGEDWGFYEYIHGKTHTPKGTRHQGWSAAASVMGHHALQGSFIL